MKVRIAFAVVFALTMSGLASTAALAAGESQTYELELEAPNTAQAPNGDSVAVTGEGEFSVFPNAVDAEGAFVHTDSGGTVLARGTWTATALLDYQPYGCGVLFGTPLPPNLCGGRVLMSVLLTPDGTTLQIPAMLTVYCLIGDHVPSSAEEGVRLNVPGIINFNDVTGGENVYVRIA
jgi:hypothetical protein